MKVSLNIIKRYTSVDLPVDELVAKINQQLGQVEEVINLHERYKDVVIVQIVECVKHPDADKLSVCKIDDGGVVGDIERDERGLVQVVCGAPNARQGIFAAWLPPKSTVPTTFDDEQPFVLGARDLRGIKSNGMLAAADELGLGADHTGIIELTNDDLPPHITDKSLVAGQGFAVLFGLDDTIIDIENKMFTHRPDLFGQLGVAREIAGIQGQAFRSPEWYLNPNELIVGEDLPLDVFNDAAELVPRFMTLVIKGVEVRPSPFWLQVELVRLGAKPINNIVDATNYAMLLTAQPTHAYDYDKLGGHKLGVRLAKGGEKVTLLNDKTYELSSDDIVIVDDKGVVGLGGVMGASASEVSSTTKNIVLEVASFDMYAIRKTSMRHGLFTDAVTRFSKGQSHLQNPAVMSLLANYVMDAAGGKPARRPYDLKGKTNEIASAVKISDSFINSRLGWELAQDEIIKLLENVEFKTVTSASSHNQQFMVKPPFWRTDIDEAEDVVEEVGRLHGFEKLPLELPRRSITPTPTNITLGAKRRVRSNLAAAGANEVLTYSFVHENTIKKADQDPAQAFQLSNALSPDLQYYRLSLLPSLLDKIQPNIKAGHDEFALFEFGKAHRKGDNDDTGLPREFGRLAFVYSAKKSPATAYYTAVRYLKLLSRELSFVSLGDFSFEGKAAFEQLARPFEPGRSAVVMLGDKLVGVVGEFKASVRAAFKLPEATAGFEIFQSFLEKLAAKKYQPLSRFPSVERDVCFAVETDTPYAALQSTLTQSELPSGVSLEIEPLDIYQPEDKTKKHITFHLRVTSNQKTLNGDEISTIIDSLTQRAVDEHKAVVI